jgi:HAD superfamily hydrolase (TIGR01509 family)
MKTILVDAINTFVDKETGIFKEMYELLEKYSNPKIILTGANKEQMKEFGLDKMLYEVFTLEHNPEKIDPQYYETMLNNFGLEAKNVIYFEHNEIAVKSAQAVGINTYHYNKDEKDLIALKDFIDQGL